MTRWRSCAGGAIAAFAVLMALGAAAVAGSSLRPSLGYPNGKKVHAGAITLRVKDTNTRPGGVKVGVYVSIAPRRRTDKDGVLKSSCGAEHGCDFVRLRRWRRHKGWWTYRASVSFPGYWASTPHQYYWQAQSADCFHFSSCEAASTIGSFRVVG